ncbi:MAG: ECF transporter S component [Nocardioidaceae bacterium]
MSSSVGSESSTATQGRRTTVLATKPLLGYRTIDLVSAAMLGVAFGVVFWAWNLIYTGPSAALDAIFPPLSALLAGPWLLAGVVGGLLIRRPGAALLAELVAASVSALIGSQWGWTVLLSGALQGLGVEVALALFAWKQFGPRVAVLAGVLAATFEVVFYEWWQWVADYTWAWKLAYLGAFAVSGAIVAGLGGLALVRAVAKTGAVNAMPPGQEELDRSAH